VAAVDTSIVDMCTTNTGIKDVFWLLDIATGLRRQVEMNSGVAIITKAAQETGNIAEAPANS
jgi:hypothetical protein